MEYLRVQTAEDSDPLSIASSAARRFTDGNGFKQFPFDHMSTNTGAGYSGTPLAKKLGYKPGQIVYLDGAPEHYFDLIEPLPENLTFKKRPPNGVDLIHLFTKKAADLERKLPGFIDRLNAGGTIWVSWPKRASKVPTDITENLIRDIALPLGLVDIKVCAVDEIWSGLKLVRRKQ